MTLNTTALHMEVLKRAGFVERGFLRDSGLEVRRRVFVTQDVEMELSKPSQNFVAAARGLDSFRAGWVISMSIRPDADADLKLLENVDEVWSFAFRRPGMSTQRRLFGRFIEKDLFVGLGLHDRHALKGVNYAMKAMDAISEWEDCLSLEPLRAAQFSDYVGGPINDMDLHD